MTWPRVDCSVLPLLFLGLLTFQLDRMNLGSALTNGFATDIKVTQDTINLGNQLMFMGIVIWEIPCNMALQRVRLHVTGLAISCLMQADPVIRLAQGNGSRVRCSCLGSLPRSRSS